MKTLHEIRQQLREIEKEIMFFLESREESKIISYKNDETLKIDYLEQYQKVMGDVLFELDIKIIKKIKNRIRIGEDVAKYKFPFIRINLSKESTNTDILQQITHIDVEKNIIKNLKNMKKFKKSTKVCMEKILKEILFPETKRVEVKVIRSLMR